MGSALISASLATFRLTSRKNKILFLDVGGQGNEIIYSAKFYKNRNHPKDLVGKLGEEQPSKTRTARKKLFYASPHLPLSSCHILLKLDTGAGRMSNDSGRLLKPGDFTN
jgi:hypothetical protein